MKEVTLKEAATLVEKPYKTLWPHVVSGALPARKSAGIWLVDIDTFAYAVAALGIRRRRVQSIKAGK